MEYTYNGSDYLQQQGDLIDFLPETSVDSWGESPQEIFEENTEQPVLKSKDQGRINSDVVAIKSGTGDIAFVAVGRPTIEQQGISQKKNHRKTRSNAEKQALQGECFPRSLERPLQGGIDNLGYTTMTRNESYSYDDTGFIYYSELGRRNNTEFLNRNRSPTQHHQPEYVAVQSIPSPSVEYPPSGDITQIPSTSQTQHSADASNSGGQNSPQGEVESTEAPQQQRRSTSSELSNSETPRSSSGRSSQRQSPDVFSMPGASSEHTSRRQSRDLDSVSQTTTPKSTSPVAKLSPLCKSCGQNHAVTENHEYDYVDEVDEDLMCDICLQPLVDPYDTKCGHTFCCVCIKNYLRVKDICPMDRVELTNTSSDRWQSSLILRKLVNKLLVTCPHEKYCKKTLRRCDLKDHLQDVCPGAIISCPKSMYGCSHKCPRLKIDRHLEGCLFKDFNDKLSDLHPYSEDVTVELFRPEGTAEVGIMIIGGSDTPLHYIMIQEILKDSLAGQDGRLHAGDILVKINSESMFSVTHAEARAALTKPSNIMRFTLLRDAVTDNSTEDPSALTRRMSSVTHNEELVCLIKPPLEQLGIRISSSETGEKGVYIIELIPAQVAQSDGRLQVGDRIMKIGSTDLIDSTPEQAARVISSCDREVKILVRHSADKPTVVCNEWADSQSQPTTIPKNTQNIVLSRPKPVDSTYSRKVISVVKSPKENLGIIVSGGNGSPRGNLPIFVQDVLPMSVLGKDKRIKRGDLLSEINCIRLTGLSHTQAMNALRESAQQREVTLVAYELEYDGKAEDTALWDELTSLHQNPSKWAPSWKMWLAATREFSSIREIALRKSTTCNFGFKITASFIEESGPSQIFITHISKNSSASKYLKCGDEIVAINKRSVKDIPYMQVLNLMRTVNCITLKIVSWPGSLH